MPTPFVLEPCLARDVLVARGQPQVERCADRTPETSENCHQTATKRRSLDLGDQRLMLEVAAEERFKWWALEESNL